MFNVYFGGTEKDVMHARWLGVLRTLPTLWATVAWNYRRTYDDCTRYVQSLSADEVCSWLQ